MAWMARVARVAWNSEDLRGTGGVTEHLVSCDKDKDSCNEAACEKDCESQGQELLYVPGLSSNSKSLAVQCTAGIRFYGYSAFYDSPAFAIIIRFYDKILHQSEKRMEIQSHGWPGVSENT